MIDWDGNGEVDPVEVGISVSVFDEDDEEKSLKLKKKENRGCCLFPFFILFILLCFIVLISV